MIDVRVTQADREAAWELFDGNYGSPHKAAEFIAAHRQAAMIEGARDTADRIENVARACDNIAAASPYYDDQSRQAVKAVTDYIRWELAVIRALSPEQIVKGQG